METLNKTTAFVVAVALLVVVAFLATWPHDRARRPTPIASALAEADAPASRYMVAAAHPLATV